uniref:Putative myosin regulatory light chain n=1 Tax=Ixodes ricinus TaxID=34613 RepID=A0A0K8RAY1_IXORI
MTSSGESVGRGTNSQHSMSSRKTKGRGPTKKRAQRATSNVFAYVRPGAGSRSSRKRYNIDDTRDGTEYVRTRTRERRRTVDATARTWNGNPRTRVRRKVQRSERGPTDAEPSNRLRYLSPKSRRVTRRYVVRLPTGFRTVPRLTAVP